MLGPIRALEAVPKEQFPRIDGGILPCPRLFYGLELNLGSIGLGDVQVLLTLQCAVNIHGEIGDENSAIKFDEDLKHIIMGCPLGDIEGSLTPCLFAPSLKGKLVGHHARWLTQTIFNFVHQPPSQSA